jgi:hypothetical protein
MRAAGILSLTGMVIVLGGCTGSGSASPAGFAAPASTAASPAPSPTPAADPAAPTITSAVHASARAGATAVAAGDTIRITFSRPVALVGATDPSVEFALPVKGDSFGQGASLAAGAVATDVVITLGNGPNLRVSGVFDVANVGSGDSSGIDVPVTPTGHLASATGLPVASAPSDLGGEFVEGWQPAANMKTPRGGHTATLLNDGRILVVGGVQILPASGATPASAGFVEESEVFDPVANTFTKTDDPALGGPQNGDMFVIVQAPASTGTALVPMALPVVRLYHTAVKLADGRVLVSGGFGTERLDSRFNPVEEELHSSHIFDPATNTFSVVPNGTVIARQHGYGVLLPNGTVLLAGGYNSAIAPAPVAGEAPEPTTLPEGEIFDPLASTFTPLSQTGLDMVAPRQEGVALYDPLGRQVLFSGGVLLQVPANATPPAAGSPWPTQTSLAPGAEAFGSASMKFAALGTTPTADCRWQAAATTVDGILVIGGSGQAGVNANIDVFSGGAFTPNPAKLATPRARAQADVLGGNIVVVAGGTTLATAAGAELASVEIVNADSKRVEKAPAMANARNSFTLTTSNGKVYAIGGFNGGQGQSPASFDGNPVPMAEVYARP